MARVIWVIAGILLMYVFCFQEAGMASEVNMLSEISALKMKIAEIDQLKARIAELEKQVLSQKECLLDQTKTVTEVKESLISYKPGDGMQIKPCGIDITAGATFVIQGTPNANNAGDKESSRLDASWSSDIFIQKAFDDIAHALIHLEPGQGQGLEPDLSLYSGVNRDVNDTDAAVPVTELWYEKYLFSKQAAITAGKLDPANYLDQNKYAFDETTQFLSRIFRNNPAIEWPDDNTLGARLIIAPEVMSYISFEATYFDADNNWEDIFDRPFISSQLNIKLSRIFNWNEDLWEGNYRLYWWINELDHSKLADAGEPPADDSKLVNTGLGFSIDQKLGEMFGLFSRFGWQRPSLMPVSVNPNSAPCEASWSCGLQVSGKCWNRLDDIFGFAVGQIFPSKHYKDAGNGGAAEGHFECYYKCQICKWLAITPDLQWIWNPRGISQPYQGDNNALFVYAMRGQVDF